MKPSSSIVWFDLYVSTFCAVDIETSNSGCSCGSSVDLSSDLLSSLTKAAGSNGYVDIITTVKAYSVSNSYPNPFNPSTSFSVELSSAANVSVNVYNIMGQLVDVLAEGNLSAQTYNFTWNAEGLSSGVYFIKTQVGADVHTQKVMLMK